MNLFSRPQLPPVPPARRYGRFISHAWDYTGEYEGLVNLLNSDRSFLWNDLSVPEASPLPALAQLPRSYRHLVKQIDERISKSDCLLVLAGMYATHSRWIQSEIEAAKDFRKPIIGVQPRGNERFPKEVTHAADEMAGWNAASIISAIRRQAGGPHQFIPPPGPSEPPFR